MLLKLVIVVVGEQQRVAIRLRLGRGGCADLARSAWHQFHNHRVAEKLRNYAGKDAGVAVVGPTSTQRQNKSDGFIRVFSFDASGP